MGKYFTSDLHLGHEGTVTFMQRPFKDMIEMEQHFVMQMLELPKGSDLYHLGDLAWSTTSAERFLKCKPPWVQFHIIKGNHDNRINFNKIAKYVTSISDLKTVKVGKQKIVLCHYPLAIWDCSCHNSWQLHGHIHTVSPIYESIGKQMNVNVEFTDYKFVSFDDVAKVMATKDDHPEYKNVEWRKQNEMDIRGRKYDRD